MAQTNTDPLRTDLFKEGAKIVTFRVENGRRHYMHPNSISKRHPSGKAWLGSRIPNEVIPDNGEGFNACYPRGSGPHYFYSANPEHVAEGEEEFSRRRKAADAALAANDAALAACREEILEVLYEYGAGLVSDDGEVLLELDHRECSLY